MQGRPWLCWQEVWSVFLAERGYALRMTFAVLRIPWVKLSLHVQLICHDMFCFLSGRTDSHWLWLFWSILWPLWPECFRLSEQTLTESGACTPERAQKTPASACSHTSWHVLKAGCYLLRACLYFHCDPAFFWVFTFNTSEFFWVFTFCLSANLEQLRFVVFPFLPFISLVSILPYNFVFRFLCIAWWSMRTNLQGPHQRLIWHCTSRWLLFSAEQ